MIYLDNHATTRVDPRVVEAMLPFFTEQYGNAGSLGHCFGEAANDAVAQSRESIANGIGSDPREIVFTSGATESNNLAIRGAFERPRRRGNHLISVQTEHQSVLEPMRRIAQKEGEVTLLDVEAHGSERAGWLDPQRVADAITDQTVLVSVMLANNEIGVIQPLAEIGEICHHAGVLLHCDATQAIGKIPVNVRELNIDLMSFSAHKIYGPKGIGALYVRGNSPTVRLQPLLVGGGQEAGRRSGTLNTPGIIGFAKALELCLAEQKDEVQRLSQLRARLWEGLNQRINRLELCGPAYESQTETESPLRLPGNLNVSLGDVDGEALLLAMPELAVSSGATCASADAGPSHVLLALSMNEDQARSSLRFGLGRFNTEAEIDQTVETVARSVGQLRKLAP